MSSTSSTLTGGRYIEEEDEPCRLRRSFDRRSELTLDKAIKKVLAVPEDDKEDKPELNNRNVFNQEIKWTEYKFASYGREY
jgi:hypothetical protein